MALATVLQQAKLPSKPLGDSALKDVLMSSLNRTGWRLVASSWVVQQDVLDLFTLHAASRVKRGSPEQLALLFHKTDATASVLNLGFQGTCNLGRRGAVFGRGTYFTDDPSKADVYGAGSVFIVSLVFLGRCVHMQGKDSTRFIASFDEALGPQARDDGVRFDSGFGTNAERGSHAEFVLYGNPIGAVPLLAVELQRDAGKAGVRSNGVPPDFVVTDVQKRATGAWNGQFTTPLLSCVRREAEALLGNDVDDVDDVDLSTGNQAAVEARATEVANAAVALARARDAAAGLTPPRKYIHCIRGNVNRGVSWRCANVFYRVPGGVVPYEVRQTYCVNCNTKSATAAQKAIRDELADVIAEARHAVTGRRAPARKRSLQAQPLWRPFRPAALADVPGFCDGLLATELDGFVCRICAERKPRAVRHEAAPEDAAVCEACTEACEKTGPSMAGVVVRGAACLCCARRFGVRLGGCPDGTLVVRGPDAKGWISIETVVPAGSGSDGRRYAECRRTLYFDTRDELLEDLDIIERVEIAFDRRLVYSLDVSATTGLYGVVWSGLLHFRTSTAPGAHGFPAPGYLERLDAELTGAGVGRAAPGRL